MDRDQPSGDQSTWLALGALLFVGAGLMGIMFVVLPDMVLLLLVVAGFAIFILLHYVTWGYWMMRAHRRAEEVNSPPREDE